MLVRVVSLLEGEDGGVEDAALLFQSVGLGGERQDGLIVGRQTGETELGKVVDEEVELGGHTAQTGFYQPGEEGKNKYVGNQRERYGEEQKQHVVLSLT